MCIGGSEDGIVRGMVNKLVFLKKWTGSKKLNWFGKRKPVVKIKLQHIPCLELVKAN